MPGKRETGDVRREQILTAAMIVAVRERLDGLTIRAVASEAGLSSGLIHFYYATRDDLLLALLDRLLHSTPPDVAALPGQPADASERLVMLALAEYDKLTRQPEGIELFFDFWVLGTRDPAIRDRIRASLERYRQAFEPFAAAAVQACPDQYRGTSPRALATAIVSLIEGGAIQAVADPDAIDDTAYRDALAALVRGFTSGDTDHGTR